LILFRPLEMFSPVLSKVLNEKPISSYKKMNLKI
jgi:hypothetical protein